MLRNLEAAEKHCCYVKPNSSIANTLANRFVRDAWRVDARYLEMISNAQWAKSLTHHKYRFDAHFTGEGLDLLFKHPYPEKNTLVPPSVHPQPSQETEGPGVYKTMGNIRCRE